MFDGDWETGFGSVYLSFRLREALPAGGFQEVDHSVVLPVTPNVGTSANPSPSAKPSLDIAIEDNLLDATNPTVKGLVGHDDGVDSGLQVRVYDATSGTPTLLKTFKPGAGGLFEYSDPTLAPGTYTFEVVAEKSTEFGDFESVVRSVTFTYREYEPRKIDENSLKVIDGSGTVVADGFTNNPTITGQIDEGDGPLEGVLIEFVDDSLTVVTDGDGQVVIDGTALTDAFGKFTYTPSNPNIDTGSISSLKGRAVAWDEFKQELLAVSWDDAESVQLTLDVATNDAPKVQELDLKYPNGGNDVADPTLVGYVTNDGDLDGIVVEFYVFELNPEDESGSTFIRVVIGGTVAREDGSFEFRPSGMIAGEEKTVHARAMEFDPDWDEVGTTEYDGMIFDDSWTKDITFTISDSPLPLTTIEGISLKYDTGFDDENDVTNDPTVKGTVSYEGDYTQLLVEFTLDSAPDQDAQVIGSVVPDADGNFQFTLEELEDDQTVHLKARVRVPDYGYRPVEFDDGSFDENNYVKEDEYSFGTSEWDTTDLNEDGIIDKADLWFEDLFNEDFTAIDEDGVWYNSDFQRDWDGLFNDVTTEWMPADQFVYDLEENAPLTISETSPLVFKYPSIEQLDPTITATIENDGPVDGLLVEILVNGETDGTAVTDADGTFIYVLKNYEIGEELVGTLMEGRNEISLRIHEPVYGSDELAVSEIDAGRLKIDANPQIYVESLTFADGRPVSPQTQSVDSTLVGSVKTIGNEGAITVRFDYDGDGTPDGQTTTDGNGRFEFTPDWLDVQSGGSTSIRIQVVEELNHPGPDFDVRYHSVGPWRLYTWTLLPNTAPEIVSYELKQDSYLNKAGFVEADGTFRVLDRITTNPTLNGRVENDNGIADLIVEFDHDGNGEVDGTAVTDSDGRFEYLPEGLNTGSHDIRARVTEVDAETGDTLAAEYLAGDEGWARITATGVPAVDVGVSANVYGLTLVSASVPSLVAINTANTNDPDNEIAFRHLNNENEYDPTLSGTVRDDDGPENVVVDFFLGATVSDENYLGSVAPEADGSFEFTPAGLATGTNVSISAIARKTDFALGEEILSASLTVVIGSFQSGSSFDWIAETVNDKPFKKKFADDPFDTTVVGKFTVNEGEALPLFAEIKIEGIVIDAIPVQIDVSSDDSSGYLSYRFEYTPELVSRADGYDIEARIVGTNDDGYIFGTWKTAKDGGSSTIAYDLQPPEVVTTSHDGWELENDNTYSPTLIGDVAGEPVATIDSDQPPLIEFDLNGDGVVDDSLSAGDKIVRDNYEVWEDGEFPEFYQQRGDVTHSFRHTFENLDPDTNEIRVRVTRYEIFSQDIGAEIDNEFGNANETSVDSDVFGTPATDRKETIVGEWITVNLNLDDPTPSFEEVPALANPIDGGGDIPEATDPTIVGKITSKATDNLAGMTVEIDHDGDEQVDGTTVSLPDGTFSYTPQGLPQELVTLAVRVVDLDSENEALVSDWEYVTFTYRAIDKPLVEVFELEFNEGTAAAPSSSNPRFIGTITRHPTVNVLTVEFDHGSNGTVDGSVEADFQGSFAYSPADLPYGVNTIRVRAVAQVGEDTITGEWADLSAITFFHDSAVPPVVADLQVVDNTTGEISGRLTVDGYGVSAQVEIFNSITGETNGIITTAENGYFRYVPYRLTAGTTQLQVRGLLNDPASTEPIEGDWQTLDSFDYAPEPLPNTFPSIVSVDLKHDTGESPTDTITADTTISGEVSQYVPGMVVNLFNWETYEGVLVAVRPDATFEHVLEAHTFSQGYVTGIILWDPFNGVVIDGDWDWGRQFELTFNNSHNLPAIVESLNLRDNQSGDFQNQVSESPVFVGTVSNDGYGEGHLGGLSVRFDHNGDGIYDGTAITNPKGEFIYRASNLPTGDAIQTIEAWVEERDYFDDVVPNGASTTRNFKLTAAPLIESLDYESEDVPQAGEITHAIAGTAQLTDGHAGRIEYVLFANGLDQNEPPESMQNYEPGDLLHDAVLNADRTFEIDLSAHAGLAAGLASISARVVNETTSTTGPWETLSFYVVSADNQALPITDFRLFEDTGDDQQDDQTSNPTVTGNVALAYATIQFTVDDTDALTPSDPQTYRTVADSNGKFSYTFGDLVIGTNYLIFAAHVHFDQGTSDEVIGPPSHQALTPTSINNWASITSFEQVDGTGTGPSNPVRMNGTVINDGNLAGLRVEYDSDGNGEANGFTFTDADGNFEFPVYELAANVEVEIRVRVVEWDRHTQDYLTPEFSADPTERPVRSELVTPDEYVPGSNAYDEQTADAQAAADAAVLDVVYSHLSELGLEGSEPGTIDIGFGDLRLRHQSDADFLEDTTSTTSMVTNVDQTLQSVQSQWDSDPENTEIAPFTTDAGVMIDGNGGTYEFAISHDSVPMGSSVFVFTQLTYTATIPGYQRDYDGADGNTSNIETETFYSLVYIGHIEYDASTGLPIGGNSYTHEETTYSYIHSNSHQTDDGSSITTVAGVHTWEYESEGGTFDSSLDLEQTFSSTITTEIEVWEEENRNRSSESLGGVTTNTSHGSSHGTYDETITDEGTLTITDDVQTVDGVKTVIATSIATGESSQTSSFNGDYEDGRTASSSSSSQQSYQYVGNFDATIEYTTGEQVDTNYAWVESFNATASAGGNGSSSQTGERNRSETWNYNVASTVNSALEANGNILEDHSGSKVVTTWSSTSNSEVDSGSSGSSGSSVTWDYDYGNGKSNDGTGQSSATFTSGGHANDHTSANGIDDDTWSVSVGGVSSNGTYNSISSVGGSSESDGDTTYYSSRSSNTSTSSGGVGYRGTETPEETSVGSGWSISSTSTSVSASDVRGTQTDDDGNKAPFRANSSSVTEVTISGSGSGSYERTTEADGSETETNSSGGRISQVSDTDTRSSSYVGIVGDYSGFSLTKSQGHSLDDSTVNYSETDGVSNSSGSFTGNANGSSDTKTHVTGTQSEGNRSTTINSTSNTGSSYNENSSGTSRDDDGNSSANGTSTSTGKTYGSSRFNTNTIFRDGSNFTSSSNTVTTRAKGNSTGTGTAKTTDGELTSRNVNGSSDQFARVTSDSNYYGNTVSPGTEGLTRIRFDGGSHGTAQTVNYGKGSVSGIDDNEKIDSSGNFQNTGRYSGNSSVSGSFNGQTVDSRFGSNSRYGGSSNSTGEGNSYGIRGKEDGDSKVHADSSSYSSGDSTVRANGSSDSGSSSGKWNQTLKSKSSSDSSLTYDASTVSRDGYDRTSGSYRVGGNGNSNSTLVSSRNSKNDDGARYWSSGKTKTQGESDYSANGTFDDHDDGRGGESSLSSDTVSANSTYTVNGLSKGGSSRSYERENEDGSSSDGFYRGTNNTTRFYRASSSLSDVDSGPTVTTKLRYTSNSNSSSRNTTHPGQTGGETSTNTSRYDRTFTVSIDDTSDGGVLTERSVKLGTDTYALATVEVDNNDEKRTIRRENDYDSTTTYSTGGGREKLTLDSYRKIENSYEVDVKDENGQSPSYSTSTKRYSMNDTNSSSTIEYDTYYSVTLDSRGKGRFSSRESTTTSLQKGGSVDYDNLEVDGNEETETAIEATKDYTVGTSALIVRSGQYGAASERQTYTHRSTISDDYQHRKTTENYIDGASEGEDTLTRKESNSKVTTVKTDPDGGLPTMVSIDKNRLETKSHENYLGSRVLELGLVGLGPGINYSNHPYTIDTTTLNRRVTSEGVSGTERAYGRSQADGYYDVDSYVEGYTGYSWEDSNTNLATGITHVRGSGSAGPYEHTTGDENDGEENDSSSNGGGPSATYSSTQFSQRAAFSGGGGAGGGSGSSSSSGGSGSGSGGSSSGGGASGSWDEPTRRLDPTRDMDFMGPQLPTSGELVNQIKRTEDMAEIERLHNRAVDALVEETRQKHISENRPGTFSPSLTRFFAEQQINRQLQNQTVNDIEGSRAAGGGFGVQAGAAAAGGIIARQRSKSQNDYLVGPDGKPIPGKWVPADPKTLEPLRKSRIPNKRLKKLKSDIPDEYKQAPYINESGTEFARRMLEERGLYDPKNTGPGSLFNQLKKFADSHFE